MKKRKRAAHRAQPYFHEEEDTMSDTEEIKQHTAPLTAQDRAPPARWPTGGAPAALRIDVDKSTPVDTEVIIARLPSGAAVIGGGAWVSEAFDGGGTMEVGNEDDSNTYVSVDLGTVGFTPLNIKPVGAPRDGETEVLGHIEGASESTEGKAVVILLYA